MLQFILTTYHYHFNFIRMIKTNVTWNIERDFTAKNCILVDFSHHWYLYVTNADHELAALDWNYASVQDTAGHSELKLIDDDFSTFEIDVGPSTSRALTFARTSNIFLPISRRSDKI